MNAPRSLRFFACALGLVFASSAQAECPFPVPKAKSLSASFVQAFVSCGNPGGNVPNATIETGTWPSCAPQETFNQQAGSPGNGWLWGPKSKGTIKFGAAKNKVVHTFLNTDPNAADMTINLSLSGIMNAIGPAGDLFPENGYLSLWLRRTVDDRSGGPMTMIDFPYSINFSMSGGKAKAKTSLNVILNQLNEPALPDCTSLEIVFVNVRDPNGNAFGSMGIALPES